MTSPYLPVQVRTATPADIPQITAVITSAFFNDPLWGPAFPDVERRAAQASVMWELFATSSLRNAWTLVTPNVEAAAVWAPPGATELTHEEEAGLEALLTDTVGVSAAEAILEVFGQLEEARPAEPHYYLSLLGTHDDHRGKGIGMGLLAENLARVDALGGDAYLESSNPAANNRRYEKAGFVVVDEITVASGHVISTMWRAAR